MLEEPRSGRLAAWGNALLSGEISPDEATEQIRGDDYAHRVVGVPGEAYEVGLALALGRLRALGAKGFLVALPVPGHPLGLAGPPEFNTRALAAGEAVLVTGGGIALGLVPAAETIGPDGDERVDVVWECLPVREAPPAFGGRYPLPADVPSLGEAERELAEAMRETTEVLSRLDVAGSGPVAQAALEAYRARAERGREVLAPGYPPRAVRVLELAQRVGALVAIAQASGEEHGAAVSSSEMAARREALRPLERTARRARVAAYNAFVEELERRGRADA